MAKTSKCGVEHDFEPDTRFCCKLRYMRESGGLGFLTPKCAPGVSWFDTTIAQEQRKIVAEAASNGWEARQKHVVYDR